LDKRYTDIHQSEPWQTHSGRLRGVLLFTMKFICSCHTQRYTVRIESALQFYFIQYKLIVTREGIDLLGQVGLLT
jgi:hypothetical protein